jgi:FkbM family methyltransferase
MSAGLSGVLARLLFPLVRWLLKPRRRQSLMADVSARLRGEIATHRKIVSALHDAAPETARKMLLENDADRLRALLEADDFAAAKAALHAVMLRRGGEALRLLLADDNGGAALREILHPRSKLLAALLLADDSARLKAVLALDDYAAPKALMGPHSSMLRAVLAHDHYRGVREALSENGHAALLTILQQEGGKTFRELLLEDESRPLMNLLRAGDHGLLRKLLFERGLMRDVTGLPLAAAWFDFARQRKRLAPWLPEPDAAQEARFDRALQRIKSPRDVPDRMLDAMMEGDDLTLAAGVVRFPDRHALWTLLHELLANEDYYAEIDSPAPRILDCGAHQGLSLFYFKTRFPGARITAFEPDPSNRAIAQENMRRNGFSDVEVLPYALAAQPGIARFLAPKGFSMAGSLTARRRELGNEVEEVEVECVPLSRYLDEPVDYLKMDIEGVEDSVLEEAAPLLPRVHYLFCEYHHGLGLAADRLPRILALLERAGFDTQTARSYTNHIAAEHRPMNRVGEPYSAIIFAKNRTWPPTDACA